ncbi:MAG: ankyrin repeat domain-containing protein, partial [Candidatus Omnitrophica bacterium]|nr:ankyrin repeat domain-containing protein [Candidatus Omnitrophota bacterium]
LIPAFLICPARAETAGKLYTLARQHNWTTVQNLLETASFDQDELNNVLGLAVAAENSEMIELLARKGADINHLSSWDTPLLINAIMHDKFTAAKKLVLLGADIKVRGYHREELNIYLSWDWTPLMCAARQGRLELVQTILDKGADVNETGWSQSRRVPENAADIAAYSGHMDVLQLLLKKGAILSPNVLHKAVRAGRADIVKFLITEQKSDVNFLDPLQGKSPLMEAAWWGHKDILLELIHSGADVNQKGSFGHTPLGEAIRSNNPDSNRQLEVIVLLVENGADVADEDNVYLMTPLQLAIEYNRMDVVSFLEENME